MKYVLSLVFFLLLFCESSAQYLKSGPMLGYNAMREVGVWMQLETQGYVSIKYWPKGNEIETRDSETFYSENYKANTATIALTNLEPGTTYEYKVVVNDLDSPTSPIYSFTTQKLWQWREDPPCPP